MNIYREKKLSHFRLHIQGKEMIPFQTEYIHGKEMIPFHTEYTGGKKMKETRHHLDNGSKCIQGKLCIHS